MESNNLSRNSLAFIALANEFCQDMEHSSQMEREDFVDAMLKILPRIYISASDIVPTDDDDTYMCNTYLDEDMYNEVRSHVSRLMAEDDVYLEVFKEDMKYSDSPIATTISENLSDIYQDLYNFIAAIKDTPTEVSNCVINTVKESFEQFWGQTLLNVLRSLHSIKYSQEIN